MATILNLSNLKRTVLNTIKEHHLIEHGDYVFLGFRAVRIRFAFCTC